MTQPIKFRGFRVDGKGWVDGFYFFNGTDHGIVHNTGFPGMWTAIHPSSLGMFTGLHDRNGKEIYTGDLLHRCYGVKWLVVFKNGKIFADSLNDSGLYLDYIQFPQCEIIGNQFEQE